jgi:hypothetical protein
MSLVNSTATYTEQHLVTNGCSELIGQVFGPRGHPRPQRFRCCAAAHGRLRGNRDDRRAPLTPAEAHKALAGL